MTCFSYPLDLFHVFIGERAHRKRLQNKKTTEGEGEWTNLLSNRINLNSSLSGEQATMHHDV